MELFVSARRFRIESLNWITWGVRKSMEVHVNRIVVLILSICIWALFFNAFSQQGIPLFGKETDYRIKPTTEETDLDILKEQFHYGQAILIDCRSQSEYEKGHIPGAILMTYYEMDEFLHDFLATCMPDLEYVTYCDGTDCDSSVIVANRLKSIGYEHVRIYKGGWNEWVNAGLPIERGLSNLNEMIVDPEFRELEEKQND